MTAHDAWAWLGLCDSPALVAAIDKNAWNDYYIRRTLGNVSVYAGMGRAGAPRIVEAPSCETHRLLWSRLGVRVVLAHANARVS